MANKQSNVIKKFIFFNFIARLTIITAAIALRLFHWLEDDFLALVSVLIPLLTLYITIYYHFKIKNKILRKGKELTVGFANLGLATTVGISVVELILICYKSYDNTLFGNEDLFCLTIAACEGLLSIFAGVYIAELFNTGPES